MIYIDNNKKIKIEQIELYKSGKSAAILGNTYGVASSTIDRLLKKNGIKAQDRKNIMSVKTNYDKDKIIELYLSTVSIYKISKITGAPRGTIKRILKKNNVNIRTHEEAMEIRKQITKKRKI